MQEASTQRAIGEIFKLTEQGQFTAARDLCRRLLTVAPMLAPASLAASHLELQAGRPDEALRLVERCLQLDPARPPKVLLQFAYALRANFRIDEALAAAREALASPTADAELLDALGIFLSQCARYDEALEAHGRALDQQPANAQLRFHRLTVARFLGSFGEAESDCDALVDAGTDIGEVYVVRAHLRRQTPERNHVAQLRETLRKPGLTALAHAQLHYALGKELEDLGDYDAAFESFAAGARLLRGAMRYQVEDDIDKLAEIRASFGGAWRASAESSALDAAPIFVIGLPRSGTTLVERVLSSHPGISFAAELPSFGQALATCTRAAAGRPVTGRERLSLARSLSPEALGHAYLKFASLMTRPGGRFIDKTPFNYQYCALIKAALPAATIVHLSRHPMAGCFAMFKTWFNAGYAFSYDLGEIALYYAAYRRLMQHWAGVMPGEIVEVRYEQLVRDFRPEARRIVESCGLEWDDRCLAFHESPAASTTASGVQVRQPVYASAIDLWRRYGGHLKPLREALIAAGIPAEECA